MWILNIIEQNLYLIPTWIRYLWSQHSKIVVTQGLFALTFLSSCERSRVAQLKFSSLNFHFQNLSCDKPLINSIFNFCLFQFQYVLLSQFQICRGQKLNFDCAGDKFKYFNIKFAGDKNYLNLKWTKFFYKIIWLQLYQHRSASVNYEWDHAQGHKYWFYHI